MSFTNWLRNLCLAIPSGRVERNRRRSLPFGAATRYRPRLELLEDRTLMSAVSFSTPINYAVGGPGSILTTVAVGDFNGDGKPDLAVSNFGSSTVSVFLGNGDGSFQAAQNFAVGIQPLTVAIGDFNGDGKLDLALGSQNNVSVLLGNGDGTFQTAQNFATGGYSASLAVGDFNGDGKLDLAVANLYVTNNADTGNVVVLLGNGDGTFQTAQNYALGNLFPGSVAVGDFNGDGKLDVAVADTEFTHGTVSVLLGNGDGTFQAAQNFAAGGDAESLAVGDFNGDGKLDLATVNNFSITGVGSQVGVLLGNGDGTFQAAQNFPTGTFRVFDGSALTSVKVGDFNGDGKADLAVANANSSSPSVRILLGNGDGTFQTAQSLPVDFGSSSLAVGDFNGDRKPDLAVTSPYYAPANVSVLLNQFVTTTAVSGPANSTYAQSVTYSATVTSGAAPLTLGTVTFMDGNSSLSAALPLDANGRATFNIATLNAGSHTITASYSGTPGGAGTTGFGASAGNTSLMVNPALLIATAVNFSPIAGAPFSGTVATFTNADPFGSATSYTAIIAWGDGTTSTGAITGTGTLTVSGSHTYADPGIDAVSVQISHNLGNTTTATVYPTANVTSLGQGVQPGLTGLIGFWHNKKGQALINAFNGGSNATALSTWLATSFVNLYGAGAGANNLTGFTNAQVAAFYQVQFALPAPRADAQALATALDVYATTSSLGSTAGAAYGFTISTDGLGADSFNVGADGAAFGVAKNTTLNVFELLKAVDRQAVSGVLYNGDATLLKKAKQLFVALNQAGSIS